jgi:hypothetical protein
VNHPQDPARIEAALSAADLRLVLIALIVVFALVTVAACAVPVLDAVRRRLG